MLKEEIAQTVGALPEKTFLKHFKLVLRRRDKATYGQTDPSKGKKSEHGWLLRSLDKKGQRTAAPGKVRWG